MKKFIITAAALVLGIALLNRAFRAEYGRPVTLDVEHRGHKYIMFRVENNYGQCYVHDPDCPCKSTPTK